MKGNMKHEDDRNCKNANFTGATIISSFKNLYFCISDHLYVSFLSRVIYLPTLTP